MTSTKQNTPRITLLDWTTVRRVMVEQLKRGDSTTAKTARSLILERIDDINGEKNDHRFPNNQKTP